MIEIIVAFLGIYGALAAPRVPHVNSEFHNVDNDAEVIDAVFPGAENLGEKAIPLSRLYSGESDSLQGTQNLAERSQILLTLPGVKNLAEKAIPDYVIRRMADPANKHVSSYPQFVELPNEAEAEHFDES